MKTKSSLATLVGAIPGATPPVIGWTGASGEIGLGGWVLFAILFLWQLPHFLAIAWLYREDYRRAGMPLLTVNDPDWALDGAPERCSTPVALLPVSLHAVGGRDHRLAATWSAPLALRRRLPRRRAGGSRARRRTRHAKRLLLASVSICRRCSSVAVADHRWR